MSLQPVPDIPARFPFADLEKRMGGGTVAEFAHRLDLPLAEVRRMRTAGLTRTEAEELATTLELDVDQIWPETEAALPDGFEWVEAPPGRGGRNGTQDLTPLVRPLLTHPGRWAKIKHYKANSGAATAAKTITTGKKTLPPGRWEAVGRRASTGGSDLYVRYIGPAEP